MAALTRKRRCGSPPSFFLDEPAPAPPHLAKRGRFSPVPSAFAPHPQQTSASRVASLAGMDNMGMEECAGVLVEQMSAATDLDDARTRASAILKLIEAAVTNRTSASASSALRARVEALERDNGVLKHGVAALHRREVETKAREEEVRREAAELRNKVAQLEKANYALAARMLVTDTCRFQAFHGPDVF